MVVLLASEHHSDLKNCYNLVRIHMMMQTKNIPSSYTHLLFKALFHFISQCTSVPYLESTP